MNSLELHNDIICDIDYIYLLEPSYGFIYILVNKSLVGDVLEDWVVDISHENIG